MLKVWGRTNSGNVQKAMWCIGELRLPHERVDAGMAFGRNKEDWYLQMNPNGLVPTIDDDGFVMWESNSICRYLAARHDPGGLWPTEPAARARAEMWMDWQLSVLNASITPLFWQLVRTPAEQRDKAVIDRAADDCRRHLGMLDGWLRDRPYVTGERLTVGDIPVGVMAYRWYALPVDHGGLDNLRAWYERLSRRPAYKQHVMLPLS